MHGMVPSVFQMSIARLGTRSVAVYAQKICSNNWYEKFWRTMTNLVDPLSASCQAKGRTCWARRRCHGPTLLASLDFVKYKWKV
eukprot:6490892-Amphidinium_carterae.3